MLRRYIGEDSSILLGFVSLVIFYGLGSHGMKITMTKNMVGTSFALASKSRTSKVME